MPFIRFFSLNYIYLFINLIIDCISEEQQKQWEKYFKGFGDGSYSIGSSSNYTDKEKEFLMKSSYSGQSSTNTDRTPDTASLLPVVSAIEIYHSVSPYLVASLNSRVASIHSFTTSIQSFIAS